MDEAALTEMLQEGESLLMGKYTAYMYDAVWSAAVAAAASMPPGGGNATGSDAMQLLGAGKMPTFTGAAGARRFLPNGEWDVRDMRVDITNFGRHEGNAEPSHTVVGWMYLNDTEVVLDTAQRIVWANGRQFPYVSSPFPSLPAPPRLNPPAIMPPGQRFATYDEDVPPIIRWQ